MEKLQAVLKQLKAFWTSLPTPKRIALVGAVGTVLIAVLLVSLVSGTVRYGYLYTELEAQDAAAMAQKLEALQVPFRVDSGGTAIRVPEEQVAKLRLDLAAQGLPKGGSIGFELFDEARIGATEFEQNVNLRRAVEGELTRSILTIDGVNAARVHLVMPERRLFAAREESASASVVLKLANPGSFGQKEVAAVAHLVSAAVTGLSQDRISIVSTDGVTLHRPRSAGDGLVGGGSEETSERASSIGSLLEARVMAQLERVVGSGNADVRVHVDLDPTMRERTEEHYDPAKTALRSEKLSEESNSASASPGVAGVPGALSNLPAAGEDAQVAESSTSATGAVFRRSQTKNWEVDRVSEKTVAPPGEVRRLSVAVLINGTYQSKGGEVVYIPRSTAQLAKLEALVKQAVGARDERGDRVTVDSLEFARPPTIEEPVAAAPPLWKQWWRQGAAIASAFLVALIVLVRRGRNRAGRRVQVRVQELPGDATPESGQLPAGVVPTLQLASSQRLDSRELRARAIQSASENSASAAVVLRAWLNSGNSS